MAAAAATPQTLCRAAQRDLSSQGSFSVQSLFSPLLFLPGKRGWELRPEQCWRRIPKQIWLLTRSLALSLALSQAVAVVGGEFEFLCLISHVYSEANNAAFVCGTV